MKITNNPNQIWALELPFRVGIHYLVPIFILVGLSTGLSSQTEYGHVTEAATTMVKETRTFALHAEPLQLDLYHLEGELDSVRPLVIFIFGGGFRRGARDLPFYTDFYQALVEDGFKVAAIDYRLGLKDGLYKEVGLFNTEPLANAVDMAVEDLYAATNYILENRQTLGVDPKNIILSGTSAGAITALTADWLHRTSNPVHAILPDSFSYKGIVAFSGAIFSTKGRPKYTIPPNPVMMIHGNADRVVRINKIKLLKKGMFGSRYLARRFARKSYPFHYIEVEDANHMDVAAGAMQAFRDDVLLFLEHVVSNDANYQFDAHVQPDLSR